jgi:hypothetical protein
MEFDSIGATAETIREEDSYSGIRVTLGGTLSRAVVRFHVDVNIGDPIWPGPQQISVPRLIDGVIVVRGYPLEMVLAEKIVTALERGTANTRWRDFVDIYALTRRFAVNAQTLKSSMQRVAKFRNAELAPLGTALNGYAAIAQTRWRAWLRKQRLDSTIPTDFSIVSCREIRTRAITPRGSRLAHRPAAEKQRPWADPSTRTGLCRDLNRPAVGAAGPDDTETSRISFGPSRSPTMKIVRLARWSWFEMSALPLETGSYMPVSEWLHYADHAVASLRRSSAGSNMPIPSWLLYAGR